MLLDVSRGAYEEIAQQMRLHRGDAPFVEQDGGEIVLLDGVALRAERHPVTSEIGGVRYEHRGERLLSPTDRHKAKRRWPTKRERALAGGD